MSEQHRSPLRKKNLFHSGQRSACVISGLRGNLTFQWSRSVPCLDAPQDTSFTSSHWVRERTLSSVVREHAFCYSVLVPQRTQLSEADSCTELLKWMWTNSEIDFSLSSFYVISKHAFPKTEPSSLFLQVPLTDSVCCLMADLLPASF